MKRYIRNIAALAVALTSGACAEMMTDAGEAEVIRYIEVAYKVDIHDFSAPAEWFDELEVKFNNFAELTETVVPVDAQGIARARITPGIYNVTVRKTEKLDGKSYILNALNQNVALIDDVSADQIGDATTISVRPILGSPLCFREIYYAGAPGNYFRGQFYEIYNNGDEVVYLDHLCLTQLHPAYATATLPKWPDEDGVDKYAYGVTLWQIQGDGDDWPLLPGESVVISQEAADHTKIASFSGSFGLIDNSKSEWECWAGNPQRVNEEVPDLPYVFWSGTIIKLQWLTAVSGSAFCLYQPGRNLEFGDDDYWKVGVTTRGGRLGTAVRPHASGRHTRCRGADPHHERPQHEAHPGHNRFGRGFGGRHLFGQEYLPQGGRHARRRHADISGHQQLDRRFRGDGPPRDTSQRRETSLVESLGRIV